MPFFLSILFPVFVPILVVFPALASADEKALVVSAEVALEAELWKRPTGAAHRLKFTPLSDVVLLEASLESVRGRDTTKRSIEGDEISATVNFHLVLPKAPERPFVVTQTRIYHEDFGLIAECANYDSIENELAIGVGVCSGIVNGVQFGASFSKVE